MIFNINSTRGQNAGPHVRSTGNLSSSSKCLQINVVVSVAGISIIIYVISGRYCLHNIRKNDNLLF